MRFTEMVGQRFQEIEKKQTLLGRVLLVQIIFFVSAVILHQVFRQSI